MVELLVVIATMTILIGSTIAGFSWMRQTRQAESAAEEIKNQLVLARSTALAQGKNVEVSIAPPARNRVIIKIVGGDEIFNKQYSNFQLIISAADKFSFIGNDANKMGQVDRNSNPTIEIKRGGKTEATLEINYITGNVEIK